jgi:DNA-binding Lrp family transcriptional regulator
MKSHEGLNETMLNELEKKVIFSIQGDIPIVERPYRVLAERLQIDEETFLNTLRGLCERGIVRRLGATLRHQKSGYEANAMTAWQVAEDRVEEVGRIMAGFREVSHCYRRDPAPGWPYNLYTMIHGRNEEGCRAVAEAISRKTGVSAYLLLFSRKEMKKTSMTYFAEDAFRKPAQSPVDSSVSS